MEKIKFLERDVNGKKNKILNKEGFIPAVVYNAKTESQNIMLDSSIAKRIVRSATSTTILDAELEDKVFKVVVKEVDMNPLTDELKHIAFFEIDESKEMVFSIPFELIGISPAVKNNLGVMVKVMDALDVRCKVNDLIPSIKVDISGLEHPGQSIYVEDLDIPKNISFINEDVKHSTVVTITEVQEEIITTPTEETVDTDETTEETTEETTPEEQTASE